MAKLLYRIDKPQDLHAGVMPVLAGRQFTHGPLETGECRPRIGAEQTHLGESESQRDRRIAVRLGQSAFPRLLGIFKTLELPVTETKEITGASAFVR